MTVGPASKSQEQECKECHDAVGRRRGIRCSICRKWYCLGCYQKWHIFDCQETADGGVK